MTKFLLNVTGNLTFIKLGYSKLIAHNFMVLDPCHLLYTTCFVLLVFILHALFYLFYSTDFILLVVNDLFSIIYALYCIIWPDTVLFGLHLQEFFNTTQTKVCMQLVPPGS